MAAGWFDANPNPNKAGEGVGEKVEEDPYKYEKEFADKIATCAGACMVRPCDQPLAMMMIESLPTAPPSLFP